MFLTRSVPAGLPVLAAALLLCAPATTAIAGPVPASPGTATPAATATAGLADPATAPRPGFATPSAGFHDDLFGSDSCDALNNGSPSTFTCEATGWWFSGAIAPLVVSWNQGDIWGWRGVVPEPSRNNQVTVPNEVSCGSAGLAPTCLIVGLHYDNVRYETQFAELCYLSCGIVNSTSPPGSTWSSLQDVSCASTTFCMSVGLAGTSRKIGRRIVYASHATAYTWTGGSALTRLTVPAPAHSRASELAGVSCPTTTQCMTVGNYTNASGKSLTYSALWSGGSWTLQSALNSRGQASTDFQDISCPTTTQCMAVGDSTGPGSHGFAEEWTGGTWQASATPAENGAALTGVSCPTSAVCVASGVHGNAGLIEAWNGTSWSVQPSPGTKAPWSGDVLLHVSCVTPAECAAVGYRFSPAVRRAKRTYRTLAEVWDGTTWQVNATPDP